MAPAGSCLNDPTLAQCPAATRIVGVPANQSGGVRPAATASPTRTDSSAGADATTSDYGDAGTTDTTDTTGTTNTDGDTAYAAMFQCGVRAGYPYYSVGEAWGNGANQCTTAASWQELYVSLERWRPSTSSSVLLDTAANSGPGGTTIRATARYNCSHTNYRTYRTTSEGYSVVQGVWYAAIQRRKKDLTCP
jgi:hypothetical protein